MKAVECEGVGGLVRTGLSILLSNSLSAGYSAITGSDELVRNDDCFYCRKEILLQFLATRTDLGCHIRVLLLKDHGMP